MRLLLVEDNERLSNLLSAGLTKEGFSVDAVGSVEDAMGAITTTHFAAIILDLGLPDGDGLELVRQLRAWGNAVPVLILTARMGVDDRVKGLHHGADDYLGKPFAFEELVARVKALLRRPAAYLGSALNLGNLSFDTASREIVIGGSRHALAPRESAVLETLLHRSNRVVPKKMLEDRLYGLSEEGSANAIEVYVHRLRKQLSDLGADVVVQTIRGVGYQIREGGDG